MASVELNAIPATPEELEDYVAALFAASGHFVETKVIERDEGGHSEILELDAVATSYATDVPDAILAEAKSGDWGYADVFKLLGWMTYLGRTRGAFFASKASEKDPTAVADKIAPHGVKLIHLGTFEDPIARFTDAGLGAVPDPLCLTVWRYFFVLKRRTIKLLRDLKKSDPTRYAAKEVLDYHAVTNDRIFFLSDPLEQLAELYGAYQQHPRLSLGACAEIDGGIFDPKDPPSKSQAMKDALYLCEHPLVQAAFFLEHRARLAIMKAAVDFALSKRPRTVLRYQLLPASLRYGLEAIEREPYFRLYPVFWQVFLWSFGGFCLEDRRDVELKWLAEHTGIPVDEVPRAFKAYDALFQFDGGSWITTAGASQAQFVKMFPAPFRGLGAWHRLRRYGLSQYNLFGYADRTLDDLIRWNNAAHAALT